MIRKAKLQDVPAIVELAVESVSTISPIEELKINRAAMKEQAEQCLNPAHFLYVSEIDGKVVGAMAASVCPSFWHEKLQCSVLLHYSRIPGEWVKLMREFSKWVKSRSGIKLCILELEPDRMTDERIVRFVKRLGFERESMNLQYIRGR